MWSVPKAGEFFTTKANVLEPHLLYSIIAYKLLHLDVE